MSIFNRHKHIWKIIKILQGEYVGIRKGIATQIYWECTTCPERTTTIKEGWWEIEELESKNV